MGSWSRGDAIFSLVTSDYNVSVLVECGGKHP